MIGIKGDTLRDALDSKKWADEDHELLAHKMKLDNLHLKKIKGKTYLIVDNKGDVENGKIQKSFNYKLLSEFLNGKRENDEAILEKLSREGMVIVNTLTTSNTTGPNLICIDQEKFSELDNNNIDKFVHMLENPDIIEHSNAEQTIRDGNIDKLPPGDITIWNPNKNKLMGLLFSNSAPTITIKSDNGMVGMGVLRRQYITKEFFQKLQNVMGGNITIDVVSSTMNKYPAVNENGDRLLEDASDESAKYTLPEYINDVLNQINEHNHHNNIDQTFTCNYQNCIDIDTPNNSFFKTGEKTEYTNSAGVPSQTLGNSSIIFDPSNILEDPFEER